MNSPEAQMGESYIQFINNETKSLCEKVNSLQLAYAEYLDAEQVIVIFRIDFRMS